MHFTINTLTIAAALLAGPAAAGFDRQACNSFGACTVSAGCNYWPNRQDNGPQLPEYDCGTAGTINGQTTAGAVINFEKGQSAEGAQIVARADFPRCDLAQPSATATLLKSTYQGVTVYGWIEYSCTETTPIPQGCYSSLKNASQAYTCKVFKDGQACKHVNDDVVNSSSCPK
ncbi:hypothetical protein Micbo1qcDRAFT_204999 [Microdochium bolleyi]|uniref:Uncharacterized protein n=1 Tax=Microdochium bolleyi TaxID=196109 RepID=A0A136J1Q5_9PEZI|nr:hypothetical protein Micbo1qcDRAFT_204999 [Microdochium bolleyi]